MKEFIVAAWFWSMCILITMCVKAWCERECRRFDNRLTDERNRYLALKELTDQIKDGKFHFGELADILDDNDISY